MGKTTLKATASKDELAKQKSLEEESPDDAGVKEPSKASTSTRPSINKQCKEKDYKAKHDGTEEYAKLLSQAPTTETTNDKIRRAGSSWTENYKRALVSTQEIAKLQAQKPTTAPNEDKRRQRPPNCPERYGNALMSDRSPDHVGLSYFDGLPWDKPDAVSRSKMGD